MPRHVTWTLCGDNDFVELKISQQVNLSQETRNIQIPLTMEPESYNCLRSHKARVLFGFENDPDLRKASSLKQHTDWIQYITQSIREWPQPCDLLLIGKSAFDLFLQLNVTGPPLHEDSTNLVFPSIFCDETKRGVQSIRKQVTAALNVDGEAVYQLIPSVELFYIAKCIFDHISQEADPVITLGRLRVNFWHQKLLTEVSPTLQDRIYQDLEILGRDVLAPDGKPDVISSAQFLIERANIHMHHGFDEKAKEDLILAAKNRSFEFTLTGRLGKRTKFQEKELSQLVVLAKSAELQKAGNGVPQPANSSLDDTTLRPNSRTENTPQVLELNDDTLLESISFTAQEARDQALPPNLQVLDPGEQPRLESLDAIILLATASSITNKSPADGLTREETLPFAERVISGGSSNWQVYTQALLVRSRIEGYRSRTIERGVLQLQAVVDQVIAETTSMMINGDSETNGSTQQPQSSFLPKPKQSESASASERLEFIHQLAFPPKWRLEVELAERWISLGGLRTALEIYERLEMWAEVALCWAANDQEEKARKILRQQLYEPIAKDVTETSPGDFNDQGTHGNSVERDPLPADAPRLLCILGDVEKSETAYQRAWNISNYRYARAQRSLGKYYSATGDLSAADKAYAKSLKLNPQNHPTWFALGCVRLQTEEWAAAAQAFGRAVQIEDADAESWSNLAVALLNVRPEVSLGDEREQKTHDLDEDEGMGTLSSPAVDPQRHIREAFVALERAASLKRDSFRIWQNLLSVSVRLSPPPYTEVIMAQTRMIDLRGKIEGEKCVDVDIVEALVAHLIAISPSLAEREKENQASAQILEGKPIKRRGLENLIVDLVQKKITPLITSSRRLWLLTAKLSLHLGRPAAALASYEKAWRVTLNRPTWDTGEGTTAAKAAWTEVSESTIDLADAYESLGQRQRESGMGAGEPVARDWKFKARSALRSIISRAKAGWEGDQAYENLQERLAELKGG